MALSGALPPDTDPRVRAGTRTYRRMVVALVAAAVATFVQLWSVQPLLPAIAEGFDALASQAALAVSVSTGALAGFTLVWSGLADRWGRVRVITVSLAVATAVGCALPLAGELWVLVALRGVQGAALGGVPAAAVAYLNEQVHPSDAARATGVYIAGNPLGGMGGRVLAGLVADVGGWRWGVAATALLALVALVVFVVVLPRPQRDGGGRTGAGGRFRAALTTPGLLALYAQALLLMGAFMTVYNLLGFRLMAEPFGLSQAAASLLFLAYTAGMVGSAVAGGAGGRWGAYAVLTGATVLMVVGLGGMLVVSLWGLLAALVVMTFAFFCAHASASAWVGRRARTGRAQATALYTLAYYVGSSLFGWCGGLVYDRVGWGGAVAFAAGLCVLALAAGVRLRRVRETEGVRG